jgi:hypothetical protein
MGKLTQHLWAEIEYELRTAKLIPQDRRMEFAKEHNVSHDQVVQIITAIRNGGTYDDVHQASVFDSSFAPKILFAAVVAACCFGFYAFVIADYRTQLSPETVAERYEDLPTEGRAEVDKKMKQYDEFCARSAEC